MYSVIRKALSERRAFQKLDATFCVITLPLFRHRTTVGKNSLQSIDILGKSFQLIIMTYYRSSDHRLG